MVFDQVEQIMGEVASTNASQEGMKEFFWHLQNIYYDPLFMISFARGRVPLKSKILMRKYYGEGEFVGELETMSKSQQEKIYVIKTQ